MEGRASGRERASWSLVVDVQGSCTQRLDHGIEYFQSEYCVSRGEIQASCRGDAGRACALVALAFSDGQYHAQWWWRLKWHECRDDGLWFERAGYLAARHLGQHSPQYRSDRCDRTRIGRRCIGRSAHGTNRDDAGVLAGTRAGRAAAFVGGNGNGL